MRVRSSALRHATQHAVETGRWLPCCAAVTILSACQPSVDQLAQGCRAGSLEQCELACDKGRMGEDGCLGGARIAHANAIQAVPPSCPPERTLALYEPALALYERACDGGLVEACRVLSGRLAAPFVVELDPVLDAKPGSVVSVMDDATMARRARALSRGCGIDASLCRQLGASLVGYDPEGARAAFDKACERDAKRDVCNEALRAVATEAAQHHADCAHQKSYGCSRLARLAWQQDPASAPRLMRDHCVMRGARDVDRCVRRQLSVAAPRPELPKGDFFGGNGRVPVERIQKSVDAARLRRGEVTGPEPGQADKLWERLEPTLLDCYRAGLRNNVHLQGSVVVRWTVDALGYPWSVENAGSDLPDAGVVLCVVLAFGEVHVDAGRDTEVRVPILFTTQ